MIRIKTIQKILAKAPKQVYEHYLDYLHTFAEEIITPEDFTEMILHHDDFDAVLEHVEKAIGPHDAQLFLRLAVEFYLANLYKYVIDNQANWNPAQYILDNFSDDLTASEAKYLKALRTNNMSVYKVNAYSQKAGYFILENLIDEQIYENIQIPSTNIDYKISVGDHIATRIISDNDKLYSNGLILQLPTLQALEMVALTKKLHTHAIKEMDTFIKLGMNASAVTANIQLMWTKEIIECWYHGLYKYEV